MGFPPNDCRPPEVVTGGGYWVVSNRSCPLLFPVDTPLRTSTRYRLHIESKDLSAPRLAFFPDINSRGENNCEKGMGVWYMRRFSSLEKVKVWLSPAKIYGRVLQMAERLNWCPPFKNCDLTVCSFFEHICACHCTHRMYTTTITL